MDFKKWETIVLEWVNCLKISDHVKSLKDLSDGLFFSALMKLLTREHSDGLETCLPAILLFLKKQYPNFIFQYEDDINLEDLVEIDLLVISSLLLHYSCIFDRRDILTSPLCHKLSKMTQICIRAFLEDIKPEITKEEFFEIIEQCISKPALPKSLHIHTLPSSPMLCKSPLQDFLQTPPPAKLSRLQEKDKEINNLRAEIDIERFEKIDLQDELHVHKERNKKLSKQMSNKTAEIMKLRNEIAELENKSLPHYHESESRELQQRLRGEINSLEQYVAQLQNEQEQLYNERDVIKDTLRKVEGQCTIWHDKAISTERNFDDLLEKHQQQEMELKSLRAHCTELSALLEELQALKRGSESSIEIDISIDNPRTLETEISCEDLACAVVEVQLRDVQKENVELKNILKDSQENANKLNEELNTVKTKLEELQSDYEILKADNEDLLEKVSVLSETQTALANTKQKLEKSALTVSELNKCNEGLTSEIVELQSQLTETEKTLQIAQSSNNCLSENFKTLQDDYTNLGANLKDKTEVCNALEEQVCAIQVQYNELLDKYNKTDFNLQSLTENFHKLELDMEGSLQKLERFVFGDDQVDDFKDWNVSFTKIFSQLEKNCARQMNEKQILVSSVSEFEKLVSKLKSDIELLNEREAINLQERETLCNNLKCAEQKITLLENTVSSYVEKITDLNHTISEMSATISELEVLKQLVKQKENFISDLEVTNRSLEIKLTKSNEELMQSRGLQEDLQKSLESLEHIKQDFEVKIVESEQKLIENKENEEMLNKTVAELKALTCVFEGEISKKTDELKQCKQNEENLQQTLDDLKYQLFEANNKISRQKSTIEWLEETSFDQEKQFQESIQALNTEIECYHAKVNELEMNLQSTNLNYAVAQKDLKNILNTQHELQQELETCKNDYNKRTNVLKITIEKLKQNLEASKKQEADLQEQLQVKSEECIFLKLDRDANISQRIELEQELKETMAKMVVKEQQCEQLDDLVEKSNQELIVIKLEAEEQRKQLQTLKHDIKERNSKIECFEEQVSLLDTQNKELRQNMSELQSESSLMLNLKETLEKKCEELESNTWKIVSELSSTNEQLNELVIKYKLYQEKSENDIAGLKIALTERNGELEQLKKTHSTLILENQKEIDTLQENISCLNGVIESLNTREQQYIDEIRSIKDELNDTIDKYTKALQAKQEIESENEIQINNLTENLHELVEKYNNLDKTYAVTILKLNEAQEQLDVLENDKVQLEVDLLEQKAKYEDEYDNCSTDLNSQINELVQRESNFKAELHETIQKLENSEKNNSYLNDNFTKVCAEFAQLKEEKHFLYQKLHSFNAVCKELKDSLSVLKLAHIQFVNENCQNLNDFQIELAGQIGMLISENDTIKDYIRNLEDNLKEIVIEQQAMGMIHIENLEQKEAVSKALVEEMESCKEQINTLIEQKIVLEEQISSERDKLDQQKKEFDENFETNNIKIEEYEVNIIKLKCANSILETGKEMLQSEIDTIVDKLEKLEEAKVNDEQKSVEEINVKEEEIKNLNIKIEALQTQVSENVNKNTELALELCDVNESLDSLTKQHCKLQEILSEEQENFSKKLSQVEADGTKKQNLLENLQIENQNLIQEIAMARSEVETLKDKLKAYLLERQAVELEIQAANEKLLGQDSVVRRQEAAISEGNSKMLVKLEEILELEKAKRNLQEKVEELSIELDKAKRSRDEIMETQAKLFKDTENNLIRAHESATEAKNDLLKRLELMENEKIYEKQLRYDVEKLLEGEKLAKQILEIRVLELNNEKSKYTQLFSTLKHNVRCLTCILSEKPVEIFTDGEANELNMDDIENLNVNIEVLREKVLEVMQQNRTCIDELSALEKEKLEITLKIEQVVNEKEVINQEKEQLLNNYNILCNEKIEREQDLKKFNDIQITHDILSAKYQQLKEFCKNNESVNVKNAELEQKIANLEKKTSETYNTYKKFAGHSITYKIAIEKLITERNVVESILNNLKKSLACVQMKILHISDDREHARVVEQVQAFEVIAEDIQKQFLRISKKVHEVILTVVQIPSNVYDTVVTENAVKTEDLFERINFDNELEKIIDCRDRTNDLLEQVGAFENSVTVKISKPQKENVLRTSNNTNLEIKVKDEELKKRNTMLKQRLTLAENAKSNFEKKIKQLRQENKALTERTDNLDNDFAYKTLLQQHIQNKEEYEKMLNEYKAQYNKLLQEHEAFKSKQKFIPDQIKYEKELKTEHDVKLEREIVKLREAYGNLMSDNSKLDLENATMRKLLDDRTSQLSELKLVKEAYEKLLEENNKLRMELDTLKYKRNRDREALLDALKRDRDENHKIQEVRNEYEAKLEKMKDKMIQLYREEFNKEVHKHQMDQNEKVMLLKTIEHLKQNLKEVKLDKGKFFEQQNSQSGDFGSYSSSESFFISSGPSQTRTNTQHGIRLRDSLLVNTRTLEESISDISAITRRRVQEDRKYATLPRSTGMGVIEEDPVLKRNTLSSVPPAISQTLEMEDEDDDMFNNKYLTDLKEGRCVLPTGRESNASRLSELKWRNSLCPPHLKSSYPAETQFNSPRQFKEEDLKIGIVDFDDSMSTRLIPGEKPRKKDIGTTSYKKPGPPTPSKNGGRVSLQGNELHLRDLARENNESKTPKRTTPSRLKALFMGRNSSVRDNSESQPGTPRSKRLSIFRKPK